MTGPALPRFAVIDTNVFIAAAGSRKTLAWRCFVLLARRRYALAATSEIIAEYERVAARLAHARGPYRGMTWQPLYQWVCTEAHLFEPAPIGKQRSRDMDDDIFLSCALASGATCIVSNDKDLLVLEKPFGINIVRPARFIETFNT